MARERDTEDRDGVTLSPGAQPWRKRVWLAAACSIALAAAWLALTPRAARDRDASRAQPPPAADSPAAVSPQQVAPPVSAGDAVVRHEPDASVDPQQLAPPDAASDELVPSGISLFPPAGTDPTKIGIIVPEDFALPEGYLRHYQVTDDGQEMPAILLFHPDYVLLDETGAPVPLPADRVVPAELAPEGLAIELLVPPPPLAEESAP
jgi:hypothetical protein